MISEYFDPLYFFIAFAVGMLVVYITTPVPEVIYKYPTQENVGKVIYQDDVGNCYKYYSEEIKCPNNEREISRIPIQHINLEEKSRESIITQFQKMINEKPSNNIIIPHN